MTEAAPRSNSGPPIAIEGRVDIVIVNYETPALLDDCLRSIVDHRVAAVREVIVVDNSITPDDAELVVGKHPDVRLVRPASNVGYGAAANRGVAVGAGEYALVLNADTRLHGGAVDALVDEFDVHPEAAILGPRLVDREGRVQPSCARFPRPARLFLHETGLWKIIRPARLREAASPFFDLDAPGEVPWVLGAAIAIRRSAFDTVGGFDPTYFMYYEEVDLCRRLAAKAMVTRFTPMARIGHIGGASTALNQLPMQREMYRSLARYTRAHGTGPGLLRLRLAVVAIASARFARGVLTASNGKTRRRGIASLNGWRRIIGDAVRGWPDE